MSHANEHMSSGESVGMCALKDVDYIVKRLIMNSDVDIDEYDDEGMRRGRAGSTA